MHRKLECIATLGLISWAVAITLAQAKGLEKQLLQTFQQGAWCLWRRGKIVAQSECIDHIPELSCFGTIDEDPTAVSLALYSYMFLDKHLKFAPQ